VVLIILATISINIAVGDEGVIRKAENAKAIYANSVEKEQKDLDSLEEYLDIIQKGNANEPKIEGTGLTAVYWNGTTWVELTESSSEQEWDNWYSYTPENKRWANAQSEDGSMWVWIPRYEYKIDSTNKTINVRFITTEVKSGTEGYTTDSETGIVKSSDGYTIHPAFMNDQGNGYSNGGWSSELSGFWIAKYAAGYQNATIGEETKEVQYSNLKYTEVYRYTSNFLEETLTKDTTNLSYPVFKANTYAYNIISAGDAWLLSQEIDTAEM